MNVREREGLPRRLPVQSFRSFFQQAGPIPFDESSLIGGSDQCSTFAITLSSPASAPTLSFNDLAYVLQYERFIPTKRNQRSQTYPIDSTKLSRVPMLYIAKTQREFIALILALDPFSFGNGYHEKRPSGSLRVKLGENAPQVKTGQPYRESSAPIDH
jgi:hypothetical protein